MHLIYIEIPEGIETSFSSDCISAYAVGTVGGVVLGLFFGTIISCVTARFFWGVPNMKTFRKRSEQSNVYMCVVTMSDSIYEYIK